VSCYTLLGCCQLPWPQSRCLDPSTLFGGSLSKVYAFLTECSVDPALPDLLTRRGPLGPPCYKDRSKTVSRKGLHGYWECEWSRRTKVSPRTSFSLSTSRCSRVASYPVGYFGRNQLLGGSMGLSPLCVVPTSNLHVSIATIFHR